MAVTLVATPNSANANSFLTVARAQQYFDTRLHADAWDDSDDQAMALMMATRVLTMLLSPLKRTVVDTENDRLYYRTRPTWTGTVATTTQRLPWGRIGMYDRNGNAIPSNVIPEDLADATAELAMQLSSEDRTLDNDAEVLGLTDVKVGSIEIAFKKLIESQVLPSAVLDMLVPTWLTDEVISYPAVAQFDVFV